MSAYLPTAIIPGYPSASHPPLLSPSSEFGCSGNVCYYIFFFLAGLAFFFFCTYGSGSGTVTRQRRIILSS
jgi:hypothetical protein